MTPEAWTVIVVGIGLAGLVFRTDAHVRSHSERLARLEGKVDTLAESVNTLIFGVREEAAGEPVTPGGTS